MSVLVVRGQDGCVHAFDNSEPLVLVNSDQHVKGKLRDVLPQERALPCGEKAGFVVVMTQPGACSDAEIAAKLNDVFSPELERELNAYKIGRTQAYTVQTVEVDT